jgi:transcription elongation factor SPT6
MLYGPKELQDKFLTPEDEIIKTTDIPERMQLRLPLRPKPTDEELQHEAEWIYGRIYSELSRAVIVPKIVYILEFLRKDFLEVPFITNYRKDHYRSLCRIILLTSLDPN